VKNLILPIHTFALILSLTSGAMADELKSYEVSKLPNTISVSNEGKLQKLDIGKALNSLDIHSDEDGDYVVLTKNREQKGCKAPLLGELTEEVSIQDPKSKKMIKIPASSENAKVSVFGDCSGKATGQVSIEIEGASAAVEKL
jgi:hypothetical protein